jgi:hypothetical protein
MHIFLDGMDIAFDSRAYAMKGNSSGRLLQKREICMKFDQKGRVRMSLHPDKGTQSRSLSDLGDRSEHDGRA